MPIIIIFDNAYNKINVTPKGFVTRNRFAGTYVKLKSKLANKNMKLIGMFACVSSVNGAGESSIACNANAKPKPMHMLNIGPE